MSGTVTSISVDWSFQTDARAKPTRPEIGIASEASGTPSDRLRERLEIDLAPCAADQVAEQWGVRALTGLVCGDAGEVE
jgi:hypothetical protein